VKRITIFCSLFLLVCLLQAIGLDQSVDLAKQNNKTLQMANEEVLKSDQTYKSIRGYLLPQISLAGGYKLSRTYLPASVMFPSVDFTMGLDSLATYNDYYLANAMNSIINELSPDSPKDEGSLGLSLQFNQVLFLGGKLINGLRAVDKYRSIQKLKYELTEQDVVLNTTKIFYGCLLADKLVQLQEEALQTAKLHLQQVEAFNREGLVSEFDLLRARLEVAKLNPQIVQARNSRDLALAAFRKQIGMPEGADIPEGEFIPPDSMEITLDGALQQGKLERVELKLADIACQIAQVKWNAEKGNYLPNVALQGSASLYTAADDFSIGKNDFGTNYSIGIGFSLPIFTGMTNTAKRSEAQHDYQYSRLQQKDYEEMISLQITQNYQNLNNALENYRLQTENIQMAERSLHLAQVRYDNQVGIQLEVFDAQTMLSAIKLQFYQAIYDIIIAQQELRKSVGYNL
jgi:outer membrane protein